MSRASATRLAGCLARSFSRERSRSTALPPAGSAGRAPPLNNSNCQRVRVDQALCRELGSKAVNACFDCVIYPCERTGLVKQATLPQGATSSQFGRARASFACSLAKNPFQTMQLVRCQTIQPAPGTGLTGSISHSFQYLNYIPNAFRVSVITGWSTNPIARRKR